MAPRGDKASPEKKKASERTPRSRKSSKVAEEAFELSEDSGTEAVASPSKRPKSQPRVDAAAKRVRGPDGKFSGGVVEPPPPSEVMDVDVAVLPQSQAGLLGCVRCLVLRSEKAAAGEWQAPDCVDPPHNACFACSDAGVDCTSICNSQRMTDCAHALMREMGEVARNIFAPTMKVKVSEKLAKKIGELAAALDQASQQSSEQMSAEDAAYRYEKMGVTVSHGTLLDQVSADLFGLRGEVRDLRTDLRRLGEKLSDVPELIAFLRAEVDRAGKAADAAVAAAAAADDEGVASE